jgi:serine/arginine repetitive matrix protein 2
MPDVAQPVEEMVDESVQEDDSEDSRPLTPPPAIARDKREDSPHRIPSFEFKFDSLDLGSSDVMTKEKEEDKVNTVVMSAPMPSVRAKSITIESRPRPVSSSMANSSTTPASGDFGAPPTSAASGSTTTRVRQRISREMIRETIQQRMADGTLSRHASSASGHILDAEIPKRRPTSLAIPSTSRDKELPAPPPKTPEVGAGSIPMSKAHTMDAATQRPSQPDRPSMRPRSKTQSAEEVIASNVKDDGYIKEPKSALDRLMDGMNSVALSTSPDRVKAVFAKPISILQKPKDATLIPPAPAHLSAPISPGRADGAASPSSSTASKEVEKLGKKKDKERRASGKPRRKSRRSMSTGDVEQDGGAMKVQRHSAQPRLTLGFGDAESMLDAFKDETERIGSEVCPFSASEHG